MPNDPLDELQLELTATAPDEDADGGGGEAENDDDDLTPDEAAERERLLAGAQLSTDEARTIMQRTAWILNRRPEARDSDVRLMLEYWEQFYGDQYSGEEHIPVQLLFRLPKLTSLARARAKIQNTYRLFQASPEIRSRRGTMSEEERERHAADRKEYPSYHVYIDESGKSASPSDYLIVGSAWILDSGEYGRLFWAINKLRPANMKEFHFLHVRDETEPLFLELIRTARELGTTLGFRALAVQRGGLRHVDEHLEDMIFHLLISTIREYDRGRAPLPRKLIVTKDLDTESSDKLQLANLRERLATASAAQFEGQLNLDSFTSVDSVQNPLIQLADLYTSSLGRVLRYPNGGSHAKDRVAAAFLNSFGWNGIPQARERIGDLSVLSIL